MTVQIDERDDPMVASTWMGAESYWHPSRIVVSAWLEHAPFANWIMSALKPSVFVELGTHNGFSFFTFCEAADRLGLDTHCYAIDTWQGDDHSGFYGDEVFDEVNAVRTRHFGNSVQLLRGRFDDFTANFSDASIDLLHIDGRHGYEDVKHDFESWLPKLSSRGVVLFHDIAERERGFGVWQLWEEVAARYPSFSFEHGHGLGVLAVGTEIPPELQAIFDATEETASAMRGFYARQGRVIASRFENDSAKDAEIAAVKAENDKLRERVENLHSQLTAVLRSYSWRMTRPVRQAVGLIPGSGRRAIRGGLRRIGRVFRR